ncbi:MAG TPA: hypothetical protein ENJ00_08105 [Phycisphaerales bacterium]|nr:hypothetical protein [Phycisphaerales bacterium]
MSRPIRTLLALAFAFLVLGPVAGLLVGSLRGTDGGTQATLFVGQSPVQGVLAGLGVFVLATVAGIVGGRAAGLNIALMSAGLVFSWAAWLSGRIDEIVEVSRVSPMQPLIAEGAFVALMLVGMVALTRRFAPFEPDPETEVGPSAVAVALVAGLAISSAAAWLIAIEPLKGQTIGAAAVAGLVGAATARLVFLRLPGWTVIALPAALAILGPLATQAIAGDGYVRDVFGQTLFHLGWIMPMDWAAGALIGIPIGLAWTDSVIEQQLDRSA